jgi:hypothetical protein
MAKSKSGRRKRSRVKDKKQKVEPEYEDEDDEEGEEETELKTRKRSQAAVKEQMSKQKLDKIVAIFAIILILGTLTWYLYTTETWPFNIDDSDDDDGSGVILGNYTGNMKVISHVTHKYDDNSWHLIDIGGYTNFILQVENTGTREDTYKLATDNKDNRIKITFNNNNFKLRQLKENLIIVTVTTTINSEFRLPAPITINLISDYSKSILDHVTIDFTVTDLSSEYKVANGDKVSAYYTGAFGENGTLFDHSLKDPNNKDPLYISLADDVQFDNFESRQYVPVIPGFKNGIINMVPEETHVIVVPPEAGYPSSHELGGKTLIFEVYLVSNDREL